MYTLTQSRLTECCSSVNSMKKAVVSQMIITQMTLKTNKVRMRKVSLVTSPVVLSDANTNFDGN
jgi:hypothetical protein